ncbi:MAG: D-3-phosphoglycerate dehydrogenase [Alphaproteobacteria bacterium]|jgi:D-3-phosphoglycerate dehydrogenase
MAHIFFDFDSTLVSIETLDFLIEKSIVKDKEKIAELHKITTAGMNGNLLLFDSLKRRISQANISKEHIDELTKLLPTFITKDLKGLIKKLHQKGHSVYILSGGFSDYMHHVAQTLNIPLERVLANSFTYDSKGDVNGFIEENPLCKNDGKGQVIHQLNLKQKIIMVGDGMTDLEVFQQKKCDEFIGFGLHEKRDIIKQQAPHFAENMSEFKTIINKLLLKI